MDYTVTLTSTDWLNVLIALKHNGEHALHAAVVDQLPKTEPFTGDQLVTSVGNEGGVW